jgi:VanZ family protein
MKLFLKYWKTVLLTLVVIIVSSMPGNKVDEIKFIDFPHADKIVHFAMYFSLTFVLIYEFIINFGIKKIRKIKLFSFVYCLILGILLELVQKFLIIERNLDLFDLLANIAGIFCCIILFNMLFKVLKYHQ